MGTLCTKNSSLKPISSKEEFLGFKPVQYYFKSEELGEYYQISTKVNKIEPEEVIREEDLIYIKSTSCENAGWGKF